MEQNKKENSNQPLVSVLMPAYKQAEFVADALRSLQSQTYSNWEVAVVDDGSPDNVAEIVKEFADKDPRIKFYHTENHGLSGARNNAARFTVGGFIIPLDADDIFHPEYIEECVREFRNNTETRMVYCQWEFFGATSKTPEISYSGYKKLLTNNTIFCSGMYRRSDFERIGGYDEKIPYGFEDWEFWLRLLDEDARVVQIQKPLFRYRIKENSMTVDLHKEENLRTTRNYLVRKHWEKYLKFHPDPLGELQELEFMRYRVDKWKRRSFFSRLWYAITGRF